MSIQIYRVSALNSDYFSQPPISLLERTSDKYKHELAFSFALIIPIAIYRCSAWEYFRVHLLVRFTIGMTVLLFRQTPAEWFALVSSRIYSHNILFSIYFIFEYLI